MVTRQNKRKKKGDSTFLGRPNALLICITAGFALMSNSASAREIFDLNALETEHSGQQIADLSVFNQGASQLPGVYGVYVYINGTRQTQLKNINFVFNKKTKQLVAELSPKLLKKWGVNIKAFPALQAMPENKTFTDLSHYLPYATSHFQANQLRLYLSIPQAAMLSEARGWVDPKEWDEGIPAAMFNYSVSGSNNFNHNSIDESQDNQYYGNFQSGFNLGAWRFRNYSTWSYDKNNGSHWQSANAWVQRDIKSLKAQLTIGESYTTSDIFDSFQFRGIQLASDEAMLPDSLRGFAPVIHGIANSNALVTIKQNNYVIYQRNVAPGPFVIRDLYPTSSGGDLTVTVKEADGSEHSFVQPFSSTPVMLRPGRFKYALTLGQYRSNTEANHEPKFIQGTSAYGLSNWVTLYGGLLSAQNYNAAVVGTGVGLGIFGSLSLDVTAARAQLPESQTWLNGQSYRAQYSKSFPSIGTNISLAAYRYSTRHYYTFQNINDITDGTNLLPSSVYNPRATTQINLSQSMGEYGSLYVSAYQQNYWNRGGATRTVSLGYNNSWHEIGYGINYSYSTDPQNTQNSTRQFSLNIYIPLDKVLKNSRLSYSLSQNQDHDIQNQVSVNGTALKNNKLSWGIQQSINNHDQADTGYLNGSYKGAYGTVDAGYSYQSGQQQLNYTVSGGILIHHNGITLSQPLDNTVALVKAPGASDVAIENYPGIHTDFRGYAVVPYVTAYSHNHIALDSNTYGDNMDIDNAIEDVIPTEGAVVVAHFHPHIGYRLFARLVYQGKPLPFGATAKLVESGSTGIIGQNGITYLTAAPPKGHIKVSWNQHTSCTVAYDVSANKTAVRGIYRLYATCK